MELVYKKGNVIGDVDRGEGGGWFANDLEGNNAFFRTKKEAINYLKTKAK